MNPMRRVVGFVHIYGSGQVKQKNAKAATLEVEDDIVEIQVTLVINPNSSHGNTRSVFASAEITRDILSSISISDLSERYLIPALAEVMRRFRENGRDFGVKGGKPEKVH